MSVGTKAVKQTVVEVIPSQLASGLIVPGMVCPGMAA
jgi:hypothetical protein